MLDVLMMLKCESMALPVPRAPAYRLKEGTDTSADASRTSYRSAQLATEEDEENYSYFSCCSDDVGCSHDAEERR